MSPALPTGQQSCRGRDRAAEAGWVAGGRAESGCAPAPIPESGQPCHRGARPELLMEPPHSVTQCRCGVSTTRHWCGVCRKVVLTSGTSHELMSPSVLTHGDLLEPRPGALEPRPLAVPAHSCSACSLSPSSASSSCSRIPSNTADRFFFGGSWKCLAVFLRRACTVTSESAHSRTSLRPYKCVL